MLLCIICRYEEAAKAFEAAALFEEEPVLPLVNLGVVQMRIGQLSDDTNSLYSAFVTFERALILAAAFGVAQHDDAIKRNVRELQALFNSQGITDPWGASVRRFFVETLLFPCAYTESQWFLFQVSASMLPSDIYADRGVRKS